jgi:DNA-binding response OmpR family regulator
VRKVSDIKQIRTNPQFTYHPLIIATAKTEIKYKLLSKNEGCDAYLLKPLNLNKFLSTISKYLHNNNPVKEVS